MDDGALRVGGEIGEAARPARRRGRPAGTGNNRGTGQVQAIHRALSLLEYMAEAPAGVALTVLAEQAGLAPSTTHRLLKSLEHMGFVQHDLERSLWLVGVKAFSVGNAFLRARDFVAAARPFMRRLMEESGESVSLAVLEDGAAVYLSQVECREMMRALAKPGGRAPLHASGVGKALMAELEPCALGALIDTLDFPAFTDNTLTSADALRQELNTVRRLGYARDDEEFAPGLRCVAAAIHDEHGEALAAVSLSGPTARIGDSRFDEFGRAVAATAADITHAIGGIAPGRTSE